MFLTQGQLKYFLKFTYFWWFTRKHIAVYFKVGIIKKHYNMKNNTRQPGRLMLTEDTHRKKEEIYRKNKHEKGGRREDSKVKRKE